MASQWFVLDESFTDHVGHNQPYHGALAAEFRERGLVHTLVVHRSAKADAVPPGDTRRVFRSFGPDVLARRSARTRIGGRLRFAMVACRSNFAFYRVLRRELADVPDGSEVVHALYNSHSAFGLAAWVRWLGRSGRSVRLHLVVHSDPYAALFGLESRLFARLSLRHRIRWWAHSDRLVDDLRSTVRIERLPLPYTSAFPNSAVSPVDRDRVSFLGLASRGKGFVPLVGALRRVGPLPKPFRFFVQCNVRGDDEVILAAAADLMAVAAEGRAGLDVHNGGLGDVDYGRALARTALLVLPHSPVAYGKSLSGVFCEAASLGIPMVLVAGTEMARWATERGIAETYSSEGDQAAALAGAIGRALDRIDELTAAAAAAAADWRAFNQASVYLDVLVSDGLKSDLLAADR
jgi:glycosyltransferase involved in cell wall biosynthesis